MEKKEFLKIMERIEAAYPVLFERMDCEKKTKFYGVWFEGLKDLDSKNLLDAVGDYIRESRYVPSIAELRERTTQKARVSGEVLFFRFAGFYPGYDSERDRQACEYYTEKTSRMTPKEAECTTEAVKNVILDQVRQWEKDGNVEIMPLAEFLKRIGL